MSEHKQDKWLYTFNIEQTTLVDKTEEAEINGEKVKVIKKVPEKKQVKFGLKRPNRRLYEKADMFFGVQLSEGIRAGLLTKALLLKRYRNDGGALSDADAAYFYELSTRLSKLEEDHQRLVINVEKLDDSAKLKKTNEVIQQKMEVLNSLQALETVNQALFAHTAETKAQVQLNNWWICHLAFANKEGTDDWEDLFPGETYDEKATKWDYYDDERPQHIIEALARFSLLIGLWNAGAQTKADFEQGEKDYGIVAEEAVATIADNKKEETKTPEPAPLSLAVVVPPTKAPEPEQPSLAVIVPSPSISSTNVTEISPAPTA
jgi:hypothetical protein